MNRAFSLDWSPNALSPTTTKVALQKNVKKVDELKEQLQVEITEKNELSEENSKLKQTVDSLNKTIKAKISENAKLKDDIEDLQRSLEVAAETPSTQHSISLELNLVKSELIDLKKYSADLEKENEEAKNTLEKYEAKVQSLVGELVSLEHQQEDLKLKCYSQENLILELQNSCDNFKTELSDLKECNQALKEETSLLESRTKSRKSSDFQNNECLERELEFQFMKDKIEQMTANLHTIENEQAKLIALNLELTKDKAGLAEALEEFKQRNLSIEEQYGKLNENFMNLREQNDCLKEENNRKDSKIQDAERAIEDCNRRFSVAVTEHTELKLKLLAEKSEIETNLKALAEELHLVSRQLEGAINENKTYEITLQDTKAALHTKSVEFDSLDHEYKELLRDKENCVKLLQETEEELKCVTARKTELQAEVCSAQDYIEKLGKKCDFLTKSNDSYAQSLTDANHKILTLSDAKSEITANLEQLKIRHHKLQDENCSLNMRVDDLVVENENYASIMKNLKSQLQLKSNELETLIEEHQVLVNDHKELAENNLSYSKLVKKVEADLRELEAIKDDLDARLKSRNDEYEKLNSEYVLLTDRYAELQKRETDTNDRIAALSDDKLALSSKLGQLETNYNELNTKYNAVTTENEKREKLITMLSNEKGEIQTNLEQLRISFNKLTVDHNSLTRHYEEALMKRDELSELLRDRDISLEGKVRDFEQLDIEHSQLSGEHERLLQSFDNNAKLLKEVENQLLLIREEKELKEAELKERVAQYENLKTERNSLAEHCDELSNSNDILKEEKNQIQKKFMDLTCSFDQLAEKYNQLESRTSDLISGNDRFSMTIMELKSELAAQIAQYEETVAEKNQLMKNNEMNLNELKNIENKLTITTEMSQKAKQDYLDATELLRGVTEQLDSLKLEYEDLAKAMDHAKAEVAQLNAEKSDLQVRCDDILRNNLQQAQLLKELESQLERLTEEKTDVESKLSEEVRHQGNLVGSLQEKVVALSDSCATLKTTNQHLRSQIADLTQNLTISNEQLAEIADQSRQMAIDNEKLCVEIANSRGMLQNLETEFSNLKIVNEKLTEDLRSAQSGIHESKIENAELQIQIACMSADKEELRKRVDKLSSEAASLNEMVKSLTQLNGDLFSQNEKLGHRVMELESNLEQLDSNKQSTLAELEVKTQEVQEKSEAIESLTHRIRSLENDLEITTQENGKLADRFATIQNELLDTSQRIENVQALNDEYSKAVKLVEEQMHDVCFERDALNDRLRQLETELGRAHDELDSIVRERTNLLDNVTKLENLNYELQEENTSLQTECHKLEESKTNALNELREMLIYQIEQLQTSNEELKVENEKLSDINNEKLLCLKEVNKHMEMLESFSSELKKENAVLQQRVDECSQSESNWKNENTRLTQVVQKLNSENEQLLNRLKESERNEESLSSRIQSLEEEEKDARELRKLVTLELQNKEALQMEITKLQQQNAKLRSEVHKLGAHVDALDEERETMKREYGAQLDSKLAELENMRSCIEDKDNTIRQLMEKEVSVRRENEKLAEDVLRLKRENEKTQAQLEDLSKQKEELYEIEKINQDALQKQIEAMSSRNQGLLNEFEVMHRSLEELETDNEALKKLIGEAEDKINDLIRAHADELERSSIALEEERKRTTAVSAQLEMLVKEKQSHEDEREKLLKQVETLNAKLAEESQRVNVIQRSHSSQLQKLVETIKSLEAKLHHYENVEKEAFCKRIHELKEKLEEALETNEEERTHTNNYVILVKENENLLLKVDQLETTKRKLEKMNDELLEKKEEHRRAEEELWTKVRNLNEMLKNQKDENIRLTDEYNIYKAEYRKIVQHKDEMVNEYKETVAEENKRLTKNCEDLENTNREKEQILEERELAIKMLTARIEELEGKCESSDESGPKLNKTHVVASGPEAEVYAALRQENLKLLEEKDSCQKKILSMEVELEKEKELYRSKAQKLYEKISNKIIAEYEGKLQRAKAEYQKIVTQKYEAREKEWKKKEEEYKMMLSKEKDHIKDLSSQLWDISDRYLQQKQLCETRLSEDNLCSPTALLRKTRSATHLNLMGSRGSLVPDNERRLSTMSTVSEDVHLPSRRRATTISAKVFPAKDVVFPAYDEEQEIFDNACLADLKQGRMHLEDSTDFSKQRMSILQARNSLCPPHLKSSYPAETQFLPLQEFRENDIKMGLASESDNSDVENRHRKNRNQTSYKKPGPPTPSKNGGRSSQCGNVTPRNILKESNDNGNGRRKSFTPKFINNLFSLRGHATVTIPTAAQQQDENLPVTPRRSNRLSSIRRRFSRNPQELGNTNSGFC